VIRESVESGLPGVFAVTAAATLELWSGCGEDGIHLGLCFRVRPPARTASSWALDGRSRGDDRIIYRGFCLYAARVSSSVP